VCVDRGGGLLCVLTGGGRPTVCVEGGGRRVAQGLKGALLPDENVGTCHSPPPFPCVCGAWFPTEAVCFLD